MPRIVPDDYFRRPPFTRTGAFAFDSYTCNACSQRLKTWAAFKEHRKGCTGELWRHQPKTPGGYAKTASAPLSEEDMGALAELLAQVDAGAA